MSSDKKLADESTFAGDEGVEVRTGIDKSEKDRDEEGERKGEGVASRRTAVPPRKRHTSLSPQRSNGTAGGSRLQPLFGGTTSATAAAHATHAATHATHAEEEAFSSIVSAAEATKSGYVLDRTKKKVGWCCNGSCRQSAWWNGCGCGGHFHISGHKWRSQFHRVAGHRPKRLC